MTPHITLAAIAHSTPDGAHLFDGLDLEFPPVRTGLVGRNGVGKSTLVAIIAGELIPLAGRCTVEGSIGVLRQSCEPRPGATVADLFGIGPALDILSRAETGNADANELAEADWTLRDRLARALDRFGVPADAGTRLETLSGGQRTRAMLASLALAEPDFLILDEPTNNLDRDGRDAILAMLQGWRGGAIVVSHDRALLDTLDRIVELTPLGARTYGGNYTLYREQRAVDLAAAEHDRDVAERRVAQIARATQQRRERQQGRDAGGRQRRARGDQPKILLDARKERAEKTASGNDKLANRLRARAESEAQGARDRIEQMDAVTVDLPRSGLAAGKTVLRAKGLAVGHDDTPVLSDLDLLVVGPERVALTGPNGVGKTTLLKTLLGRLAPLAGGAEIAVRTAVLDQNASLLDPARSIRDNFRALNAGAGENACRAALARFRFRADAALQRVGNLSGGERLRAALACTLGAPNPPQLLVLDEPTNHLDFEAIDALESGLVAYDGALLVVSHDRPFLEAISITREIALG